MAEMRGLDLVEVSPNAQPPVCKLIDYGKFKYEQKKKQKEAKKKQVVVDLKEVKLRPQTEEHDFEFKIRHMKRFLSENDKVKVIVVFKGREIVHSDLGRDALNRVLVEMKELAVVEQPPRMEGRQLTMILAPLQIQKVKIKGEEKSES